MNKRRKSHLILLVGAVFFLGFPLAGMLYVYLHAHSTMRVAAIPFAKEATEMVLDTWDYEELSFLGTLTLNGEVTQEQFQADQRRWGEFIAVGEFRSVESNVTERGEQIWQIVDLAADVKFENGPAKLKFVAARRSTILEDWKIEEFELSDPTVE